MKIRHFIDIADFEASTLRFLIKDARTKKETKTRETSLWGQTLAMIFEKQSTRTRVSFEVAMKQMGGHVMSLSSQEMQLGRGETIADTARVLSRYVDVIMYRTSAHKKLTDLAEFSTVPVINGLTDDSHPCQVMADLMTFEEHRGDIAGKVVAWCGHGNNVARSWIHAAVRMGFEIRLASPEKLSVPDFLVKWARENGATIKLTTDPQEAVDGADCVVTDTWLSMGEADASRRKLLEPYRVDDLLMAQAKKDAIFMHCLPAHRGEEVTDAVIDGPQSVVWDEAENRMHIQKSILAWCLGNIQESSEQ